MNRNRLLAAVAMASLMSEAEPAASASGDAPAAPAAAPKPPELKNSHWCVHPTHGLGMIGELGAQTSFHRFYTQPGNTSATLDSTPVYVDASSLRLCTSDELPPHLGYTPEQLRDYGYAR